MSAQEDQRAAVVAQALLWVGTPYHHMGRVRGAGVDCATLLLETFVGAGLIPDREVEFYPRDWHLHRSAELYMGMVEQYAAEIAGPPDPGDVVLWRFGRCFSHGAIVVKWPVVVHAYMGRACTTEDAEATPWLMQMVEGSAPGSPRPRKFFSYWAAR